MGAENVCFAHCDPQLRHQGEGEKDPFMASQGFLDILSISKALSYTCSATLKMIPLKFQPRYLKKKKKKKLLLLLKFMLT